MILIGKKHGIEFVLSTNGSILKEDRIRSLVDACFGLVLITFSADSQKYESACVGGNWNKYNSKRNLVRYREKSGSS
jgi:MoaA/NifB/PqqE/SkfB family radical SAM enzyme